MWNLKNKTNKQAKKKKKDGKIPINTENKLVVARGEEGRGMGKMDAGM